MSGTDLMINHKATTTGISAIATETIFLTIECFKDWAMMSNTEQGKQVRRYFRECEKVLKEKIKLEQSLTQTQLAIQLTNFIEEQRKNTEEQRKSTELLMQRTNKLDAIETAHNHNIGIKGVITDEIENSYPDDASTTAADYLISKKIDLCYAGKLSRRAAQFKRCSTSTEILSKNNKNQTLYVGNQIAYLDEALKTILDI